MFLTEDGKVPVHWWTRATNFGDLLSPWLVNKITGRDVQYAECYQVNYSVIGSILGHVTQNSIVWRTGSFGMERPRREDDMAFKRFSLGAEFLAVRGPLTRNILEINNARCPRVYGDPALLVSRYYIPASLNSDEKFEIGIVLRWSEKDLVKNVFDHRIKLIYLDSEQIENTIDEICSCKRILTTSLHGLIIADAYGIPNGWMYSETPTGLEFKYWDYLISVAKIRSPFVTNLAKLPQMSLDQMLDQILFDSRLIDIDIDLLLSACPFLPGKDRDIVVPAVSLEKKWWFFGSPVIKR